MRNTLLIFMLSGFLVGGLAFGRTSLRPTKAPTAGTTRPASLLNKFYPAYPQLVVDHSACVTFRFVVTPQGKAKRIHVWAKFPSHIQPFILSARRALRRYTFRPTLKDGKPVLQNALLTFTWLAPAGMRMNTAEKNTIYWVCDQQVMHGLKIVAGKLSHPLKVNRRMVDAVRIAKSSLPHHSPAGHVRIRFCIDRQGHVADAGILQSVPKGRYTRAALDALAATKFGARSISGKPMPTCGMHVSVYFSGRRTGDVGRISRMKFQILSNKLPVLKVKSEKPVNVTLSIPAGTRLPQVAKVELRLCIGANGVVDQERVVHADPPKYFDKAAVKTVQNWQFAPQGHRICDVYQGIRFPLRGGKS